MQTSNPATLFPTLAALELSDLVGLWRGSHVPSGHPLDGVLENLGWFGKRFHPNLRADALLFRTGPARLVPVDPRFIPLRLALRLASFGRSRVARNWFPYVQKMLRAKGPTATLQLLDLESTPTVAMVYDHQPVTDYFRRIDDRTILGMMCVKGDAKRFFFTLTKVAET